MADEAKPSLSEDQLAALRIVGKAIRDEIRKRTAAHKRLSELQLAVNAIAGRPISNRRPWEFVLDTVLAGGRPITWEEALAVAVLSSKLALSLTPDEDLKRSIKLASRLKLMNNMVGLAEWDDSLFEKKTDGVA